MPEINLNIYETVKIKRDVNSVIWQEFTSDYHGRAGNYQEFVSMITSLGLERYRNNKYKHERIKENKSRE